MVNQLSLISMKFSDQLHGKSIGWKFIQLYFCFESFFFEGGQIHFGTDQIANGGNSVVMSLFLTHKFIYNKGWIGDENNFNFAMS